MKRIFFKGKSCNPLSPRDSNDNDTPNLEDFDDSDQLYKIFKKLRVNSKDDFNFITNREMSEYAMKIHDLNLRSKSLSKKFPYTSDNIIEVLSQLLEFNPHKRPKASEILKN
jgi:serine/threonine protein kinase